MQWVAGALLVLMMTAGCSSNQWGFPYRVGVQQGNWVTTQQVGMLYEGMTREQVRFALGSPTLTSVLHADRWDYPYFYKAPDGKTEERNLAVFFRDGSLVKWAGDEQPSIQPFQIAKDEVAKSQAEDAQVKLDQERAAGPTGEIQLIPGVDFSTITPMIPSTDPGALPDVPDQVPVPLE
jgi:outer membrane protein assembly factor BamE